MRPLSNSIFYKNRKVNNMASEKNNYNFRWANFDAMRTELDYQTFEQPIVIKLIMPS